MPANNVNKDLKQNNNKNDPPSLSNTDTRIIVRVIGPSIDLTSEAKMSNTDWQTFINDANTIYGRYKLEYEPDYSQEDLFMIFLDKNLMIPIEQFSLKTNPLDRNKKRTALNIQLTSNNMPNLKNGMGKRK